MAIFYDNERKFLINRKTWKKMRSQASEDLFMPALKLSFLRYSFEDFSLILMKSNAGYEETE